MITGISDETETLAFTPVRITKSAAIFLNDRILNVFPLFGPVREMEWADGWSRKYYMEIRMQNNIWYSGRSPRSAQRIFINGLSRDMIAKIMK
jgi:hypothetical protein